MVAKALFVVLLATHIYVSSCKEECGDNVVMDGSLGEIIENEGWSFIFVGGKGGVGKTTVSSSLAIQLANRRGTGPGERGGVLLISTDPAHSLSDAFQIDFSGKPTPIPGVDGLAVMEVDPSELLKKEIKSWAKMGSDAGMDDLVKEVQNFQQWLTSIPGIDEATALGSVVSLIDSGEYSTIVFDTAPTGHTLKLLQLPEVLEAGLSKLQSWQTKLWGYYQMFSSFMTDPNDPQKSNPEKLRKKLEKKLKKYKKNIKKVGTMLQDRAKTTFVTVCIAEYLSISESKRLLAELSNYNIHHSHVVVNQLVKKSVDDKSMESLKKTLQDASGISTELGTALHTSAQLCHARRNIQSKYLKMLRQADEAKCMDVVELPLLPTEVTGVPNLQSFSQLLLGDNQSTSAVADASADEL